MMVLSTFSVAGRCQRTGMLGAAAATAMPAVGALCPWVSAGNGVVCTQAGLNVYLGIDGLALLREGYSAGDALTSLLRADPDAEARQVGLVDRDGASAAHTGSRCVKWASHETGPDFSVQGNMLRGPGVVAAMAAAFQEGERFDLAERLVGVLEAAEQAGGDVRGRQSAALIVMDAEEWPYLSLRVDEHSSPVQELRRILGVARRQLLPFVDTLPTRSNPAGVADEGVQQMNLQPPGERVMEVSHRPPGE
jgi:uncharacterized Ntn-hydrolase superfamily protein